MNSLYVVYPPPLHWLKFLLKSVQFFCVKKNDDNENIGKTKPLFLNTYWLVLCSSLYECVRAYVRLRLSLFASKWSKNYWWRWSPGFKSSGIFCCFCFDRVILMFIFLRLDAECWMTMMFCCGCCSVLFFLFFFSIFSWWQCQDVARKTKKTHEVKNGLTNHNGVILLYSYSFMLGV